MAALQAPAHQWMKPYLFWLRSHVDEDILRKVNLDIKFEKSVTVDGKIYVVGKSNPSKETINKEMIESIIRLNNGIHVFFNPTLIVIDNRYYLEVPESEEVDELTESLNKGLSLNTDKEADKGASENVGCDAIEVSQEFFQSLYSRFQCCGKTQEKEETRCKRHSCQPFVWCFQHKTQQQEFENYASGEDIEVPKWWERDCSSMLRTSFAQDMFRVTGLSNIKEALDPISSEGLTYREAIIYAAMRQHKFENVSHSDIPLFLQKSIGFDKKYLSKFFENENVSFLENLNAYEAFEYLLDFGLDFVGHGGNIPIPSSNQFGCPLFLGEDAKFDEEIIGDDGILKFPVSNPEQNYMGVYLNHSSRPSGGETKLFYHGTDWNSAVSIYNDGILLSPDQRRTDFGINNTFYVGNVKKKAHEFAFRSRFPALCVFEAPADWMENHTPHLAYSQDVKEWKDLVFAMRTKPETDPLVMAANENVYIYGPMYKNPSERRVQAITIENNDGISFPKQLAVKNQSMANELRGHLKAIFFFHPQLI